MTKQKEIREGLAGVVTEVKPDWTLKPMRTMDMKVDDILNYLHSQGVVIKRDRELTESEFYDDRVCSVAFEPLIK